MTTTEFRLAKTFVSDTEVSYDVYENGEYVAYINENVKSGFCEIYIYDVEQEEHTVSYECDSIDQALDLI